MRDSLFEIFFYLVTASILLGIPALYLKGVRRRRARTREKYERSRRLGLSEPVTLHPVIDPARCIGTEACVGACPEGEILGVVGGGATLVSPTRCIGHGACASSCPVQAITLVFGTETRGVDLPELKPNFETNVEGVHIAGELGGMGLIRNAVTQGREAIEYIKGSLSGSVDGAYDVAIVGAGPAGLSAALKAMELGLSYICLEQDDIGGTILTYPRRKVIMTQPMNIPLYGKIRKREMPKEELLDVWNAVIARTGLEVRIKEKLNAVDGEIGRFRLKTTKGEHIARRVLLSIGRRGTPRKLGIVGEKSSKVAYRLIEPEQYAKSRTLVVGGGDSAIEAALAVAEHNERGVSLSYRRTALGRVKDRNRELFEEAVGVGKINCIFGSELKEIREKEVVLEVAGESTVVENDHVLVLIGGILPTGFLHDIGIKVNTKFGEA